MSKQPKIVGRAKKFLTSVLVLAIFFFPIAVSARWAHDVISGTDKRVVYSTDTVAEFRDACTVDTGEVRPFDEPLITISFDDGWESVYSQGFEVLEKHCIKSTQYILGGHFDEQNYLSKKQVHSMQQAGHDIAAHTMTHPNLTGLTPEMLAWELGESNKVLDDEFGSVQDFASPLGATNPAVLAEIRKNYRSHRNTVGDPAKVGDEDINLRATFDRYNINAYTVRDTTTPDDIRRLIDYTIKRKGWLILTYHQVDDSDAHYAVTKQVLDEQLGFVRRSSVRTATMRQVLDAILSHKQGGAQ